MPTGNGDGHPEEAAITSQNACYHAASLSHSFHVFFSFPHSSASVSHSFSSLLCLVLLARLASPKISFSMCSHLYDQA